MGTTVRQLMSRQVEVVEPDTTCLAVWEYLTRSGSGLVAVVDDLGRVHGVVSQSDIALAWLAHSKDLLRMTVLSILTGRLRPRVSVDTSVSRAARIMLDSQRDALPVLDTDGALIGVVTHRDILGVVAREADPTRETEDDTDPAPVSNGSPHPAR
ncbi:CBS domain-containing protein [Myceligenerans indicum]|uniref:CBS domain-containing protein n=1 Tax=Myceligenerans indicum TaxID=2593663 RepID=A0ABS1LLB0_9MICO|nr:CBS domain-containing protein [Myceligenerans indicum]MBL0886958.1 CBS domain-containing protein [Myceligenerans indicum]